MPEFHDHLSPNTLGKRHIFMAFWKISSEGCPYVGVEAVPQERHHDGEDMLSRNKLQMGSNSPYH